MLNPKDITIRKFKIRFTDSLAYFNQKPSISDEIEHEVQIAEVNLVY
jgi:hypothetical protein